MPEVLTVADLEDENGRIVTAIDDIIETARSEERSTLTDAERAEVVAHEARLAEIAPQLEAARSASADADTFGRHEARRSRFASVNVNTISVAPATASRSLDELLYATAETVVAPNGARNAVESTVVRSLDGGEVAAPFFF